MPRIMPTFVIHQKRIFLLSSFKQITTLLIVCLFWVKTMIIPILIFDYELRKDYIIQVYCKNKNRPEMQCDGKCYLAEKIAEAKEKEEKQADNTFLSHLFSLESLGFNHDFCFEITITSCISEIVDNFFYIFKTPAPPVLTFLQPPKI